LGATLRFALSEFVSDVAAIAIATATASEGAGVLCVGDSFGVRRIGPDNATTLPAGSRTTTGAVDGNASTARFGAIWGWP
jgi:hypothetical protein